jgi:hypothetical protein
MTVGAIVECKSREGRAKRAEAGVF